MNVVLPGRGAGRAALRRRRAAQGLGQKGTHALSVALGRVSGADWPADANA